MLKQSRQSNAFDGTFDQLEIADQGSILVAVSGGSDSTALLASFSDYLKRHGRATELVAVTIDHGLRPESAQEAEQVGRLCRKMGVQHIVRKWNPVDRLTGIQAAAREARYALIGEVARDVGAQFVATGHTLDDQLETVSMRALRGFGRGLSGIPRATMYEQSIWFVRPLLDMGRAALRTYLAEEGIGWIDDPSNENLGFERVRIRQERFSASERQQILGVQCAAEAQRAKEASAGAAFILDPHKFMIEPRSGKGRFQMGSLSAEGFELALQVVMSKIGGRSHFPSAGTMTRIMDFVRRGKNTERFTAHGCLLEIDTDTLIVGLEGRALPDQRYCFDYLIPDADILLANALNARLHRAEMPLPPLKNATH